MECKRSSVMVRAGWVGALVVACATATLAGQSPQLTVPATLTSALRAHLKNERFQAVTSVHGLPLEVRETLQMLFGHPELEIAEPGASFQATDDISPGPLLPIRRLSLAACSLDHCLVYYEHGGIAHTWHALLFHWKPRETRVEAGGMAAGGLKSIDEVRTAVLSGALKGPRQYW